MKLPAFLFAATVLLGQPSSPPSVIYVTSDPAGACAASVQLRFNTSNGKLWGCNAGTWGQIGGGSGSGTVSSATVGQLGYYTAATTVGGMAGSSWNNSTRTAVFENAATNEIFVFSASFSAEYSFGFNTDQIAASSVSSGNGTSITGPIYILAYGGGATTDAAGNGGQGGAMTLSTGLGGNGGALGGTGGTLSLNAFQGGDSSADGSTSGGGGLVGISAGDAGTASGTGSIGGSGGSFGVNSGAGGSAAAGTGGDGGTLAFNGGTGGSGLSVAGAGAQITFAGGNGGGVTANAATGGNGGTVTFSGGSGGASTGTGGIGGNGGDINLSPGAGNGGAAVPGVDGKVIMSGQGGALSWNLAALASNYTIKVPANQGSGAMTNDGSGNLSWQSGGMNTVAFASLSTTNGVSQYCSDCKVTSGSDNTCVGSGGGALAVRIAGVSKCVQ
jgi:hypothetical protein